MSRADRRAYGAAVLAEVRAKQRRALTAAPGQERRTRKPEEWRTMYAQAMKEKAERTAQAAVAPAPIAKRMQRKRSMAADMTAKSGAYAVIAMKQARDKFIVTVPRNADGSKAMPEIIIKNQIKARYSHREGGYVASSVQIAKLDLILASISN
jgi:hypothetical protein